MTENRQNLEGFVKDVYTKCSDHKSVDRMTLQAPVHHQVGGTIPPRVGPPLTQRQESQLSQIIVKYVQQALKSLQNSTTSMQQYASEKESNGRRKTLSVKRKATDDCGSIVCVKNVEEMKRVEKVKDCFILGFDPDDDERIKFSKSSFGGYKGTKDVSIIAEKGKVACRDYPHPRNLCGTYPFKTTSHRLHCNMCYCYVCQVPAPCKSWTTRVTGTSLRHCDATFDDPVIKKIRKDQRKYL